jgi:putative oxidoreductase
MRKEWAPYGPLVLRVILGFGFLYHGWPKLFSAAGHDQFAGMLSGIGIPAPGLMAWVVGLLEVVGGIALIAGAFVALFSALFVIEMLVAMFTVHLSSGFNFINITGMTDAGPQFGMPGYEVNLLYIGGLIAIALVGAGAWSVDEMRAGRSHAPPPAM